MTGQGEGGAVLGEDAQPDWTFQGMVQGETLSQWLDRVHPLRYETEDGPFARCPNCEEWSPCDVRTHVAQARADGAAEERERIARELDDEAQRWRDRPPARSNAAVVAVGRDASIRATEYAARVARSSS